MKKKNGFLLIFMLLLIVFVNAQQSYTWIGGASGSYGVAGNWSPNRSSPAKTDVLNFTSSVNVTDVPSDSVGQLLLSGAATVTLQALTGAKRTFAVGYNNPSGTDLDVPNGCKLRLLLGAATTDTILIALAHTSNTASFAGILVLDSSFTNKYGNTYSAALGTTTFSSTGGLEFRGGTLIGGSATRLIFQNGATITHASLIGSYGPSTSFTFPTASYDRVNLNINTQYTSVTPIIVFPSNSNAINNLTWATSAALGGPTGNPDFRFRLPSGSNNLYIAGNFTVNSIGTSGSSVIQFDSSAATTYLNVIKIAGNLTVNAGFLDIGRNSQSDTVVGNVTISGSARIRMLNNVSASSNPSAICRLVVYGNYTQTGASTFVINQGSSTTSQGIFELKGNFSKDNGNTGGGFVNLSSTVSGKLLFSGSTQQTFAINTMASNNRVLFEINNPSGVALAQYNNNGTPTNTSLILDSTLILTNGRFIVGNHTLTLSNTASIFPSTPTSTSYIDVSGTGKFVRNSVPSSGNTIFPIGTSTSFLPLALTGGTAGRNITVSVKNTYTNSVNVPNNVVNAEWSIQANATTTPSITFQYNSSNGGSGFVSSGAVLGIYASGGTSWIESTAGAVSGSNPFTHTQAIVLPTTAASLYGIGNSAAFSIPYVWNGSVSTDYQLAANWTPARTVPATTDILQFNTAGNISVSNINTATVGQVLLSNNANVTLRSQTNGARLTISSILSIPNGTTLRLGVHTAVTDSMNISFTASSGAIATIGGNLILDSSFTNRYRNSYTVTNSTTTFTSTSTLQYTGGLLNGTSASNLIFQSGSTIIQASLVGTYSGVTSFTFPTATYNGVNFNINSQYTSSSVVFVFPSAINAINNLTWATSAAPGAPTNPDFRFRLPGGSNNFTMAGNFTITSVGSSASSSGIQIDSLTTAFLSVIKIGGNLLVSSGQLDIGRNTQSDTVMGNVTLSGSARIRMLNNVSVSSNPSAICRFVVYGNYTQTGASTFAINQGSSTTSQGIFELKGNFSKDNGNTGGGFSNLSSTVSGKLLFSGSTQQTFAINTMASNNRVLLEISNPSSVALAQYDNAGIPTNTSLTLDSTLILTSGRFILGNHTLTLSNTASILPSTPTSSSYIDVSGTGKFIRNSVPSVGNTIFPIGTSNRYLPMVFTGGTAGRNITVGVKNTFTNAVYQSNNVVNAEWSILASGTTTPTITLLYNSADEAAGFSSNDAVLGVYANSVGSWAESTLGTTNGSDPYTNAQLVSLTNTTSYLAIGNSNAFVAPYTWTGSVNTDFQIAGNWTPARNASSSTDILQFNNGNNNTITNVPTATISQLAVSNNSTVSLQAQTGGSRTLTIGSVLTIASGSTLRLGVHTANDTINIGLLSGATVATISGKLILDSNFTNKYGNTYSASTGTTTFTATSTLEYRGGRLSGSSISSLVFQNGATITHASLIGSYGPSTSFTFPTASYDRVNLNINTQYTSVTPIIVFPSIANAINNLTWATSAALGGPTGNPDFRFRLPNGANNFTMAGNFTVNSVGTSASSVIQFDSSAATTYLNVIKIGGNLSIASGLLDFGRNSQADSIFGNVQLSGSGGIRLLTAVSPSSNANAICRIVILGNISQSGTSSVNLNNGTSGQGILEVKGTFSKVSGTSFSVGSGQTGNLIFNGITAQTLDATGGFTNSPNLVINNSAGVTLNSALLLSGNLTLTSGLLTTTTTNLLTLSNVSTINSASSSSYINGPLAITYASGASNATKTYPVGKGGNYRPVSFKYNSVSGTSTVRVEQFEGAITTGTLSSPVNAFNSHFWTISQTGGTSPNFNITLDATGFSPVGTVRLIQTNGTTGNSYAVTGSAPNYTNSTALTSFLSGTNNFGIGENNITTTTTVSALSAISRGATSATLTATVGSSNPGAGATVTFFIDGVSVGTGTTNSSGVATLAYNPSSLAVGNRSVTASVAAYLGYNASTSSAVTWVVNPVVPNAPQNAVASSGNATATVSFDAPGDDGGSAITSYTVTSSPGNITASGSGSPIVVTGLTNNTTYTFTVKAVNAVGSSAASDATDPVTPSSVTIWNGFAWSSGVPNSGLDGVINGNLTTATAYTFKNLTVNSGFIYNSSAAITVVGASFINNGTIAGSGTLTLSGTSLQTVSGTGTVSNLTINTNKNVVVSSSSNKLNITGLLRLQLGSFTTNGNVVLKSTSITNSATLAPVGISGNTGSISGTVQVERFIPKGYRAWRDMAPSVFNAGSIYNNWQEAGSYANNGYGLFITGTTAATNAHAVDATTGLDQTTNSVKSAYTFTNGTWNAVTNTKTTNLNPFLGYRLLVRGDRSFNLYTTPISTVGTTGWLLMNAATALRAKGNLITGNVVYSTSGITNAVAGATYNSASFGLNSSSTTGFSSVANPYVAPIDWKNIWDNNRAVNLTANYYYLDPTIGSTGAYVSYNAVTDATSNGAIGSRRYIQAGQAFFVENNGSTAPSLTITEADKAIGSSKTSVFGNTNRSRLTISLMKSTGSELKQMDGATVVFDPAFSNDLGREDAKKMMNPGENLAINHEGQSLSIEGRKPATTEERLPLSLSQLASSEYQLAIDASAYQSDNLQLYLVDAFKKGETLLTSGINNISFTVEANNPATYANRFSVVFKSANKAATTATPIVSSTLSVYPNPLVGKTITVRLGSEAMAGKYVVNVYNGLGQQVHSGIYNYAGSVLNCKLPQALAKGGYQLMVLQEGKVVGKSNLIVE